VSGGGFTKLVPEIVQSSIWNESAEVRCVWIAMLAIKDKDGNIRGNAATIARIANVGIESAREALDKFQQPDPDSNTPDKDGRRIEAVPGGWHVVNHAVYRGKDYREAEAERKRLYRQKKEMSGTCPGQVPDTSVSVSVSASTSAQEGGCKGETPEQPMNTRSTPVESKSKTYKQWDYADLLADVQTHNKDGLLKPPQAEDFCHYWIDEKDGNGKSRLHLQKTWSTRGRMQTAKKMIYDKAPGFVKKRELTANDRMNMTKEQIDQWERGGN
jgi:hypothetical protein